MREHPSAWCTLLLLTSLSSSACTWFDDSPTPQEKEMAVGQFQVGLALVHDAQTLGAAETNSEADAMWRSALGELQAAEKLDPGNAEVQYLLGMVYFVGFRRETETFKHLTSAMNNKPEGYPDAEHLMGTALVEFGRPQDAIPYLDRARQNLLYQTPYFAEQELGWAYYKLERYDEAARHLEASIVAQPDLCSAYVRLADVEASRDDHARVQEVLEQFVGKCDSDRLRAQCGNQLLVYAYYRLGMANMRLNDVDKARSAFEICIARFPRQPVASECKKTLQLLGP